MQTKTTKLIAVLASLSMLICLIPTISIATVSAAYENTHVNTGNMAEDIVAVAETQAGYLEGSLSGTVAGSNNYQKYGQWYDANVDNIGVVRAAWCAAFVSWCANQAGVPNSIVKYHAYCPYGVNWFKNQGRFQAAASRGGSYVPKRGDIVYFAPAGDSTSSHIGIVRYVSNGYVYTVEGNTSPQQGEYNEGGGVFLKSYALSYSRLLGYGIPAYQDNSGHKITFESNGGSYVAPVNVKDGATLAEPAHPSRYGFNFEGWYCNPELTDPYNFYTPVSYGFTLYAKWSEAYWGPNNNLMPNEGQLQCPAYNDAGERIWPYFNNDAYGSVTMYSGVNSDWAWPSAYMSYANSFDTATDAYIYVKYDGTAKFNALIDYLDADGNPHSVRLSEIAGRGDEDFPAGFHEYFVNFGNYLAAQGHLTTSDGTPFSGNAKFTKVTYYVIGPLDSYVKLYDMKLTPLFETAPYYQSLFNKDVSAQGGQAGSYVYDGGTFVATSTSDKGYSVTFSPNKVINPTEMIYMLMDIQSEVPFNVTMDVTSANGDNTIEFRKEFFDVFNLTEAPEALPAGTWQPQLNFNGYFYWNGGLVNEATVKNVTIELCGKGNLTLCALQSSWSTDATYVTDTEYSSGSYEAEITDAVPGDVNGDGQATTVDARIIITSILDGTPLPESADFNGNGIIDTSDVRDMLFSVLV